MRFTFAILALSYAVSVLASYEHIPEFIPDCLGECYDQADYGNCAKDDEYCLCNCDAFISSIGYCLQSTCDADDLQKAEVIGEAICHRAGVTMTTDSGTPTATVSHP
ncbi:hypothetical protein BS17DRAFT_816776 [Gyrodon lividus]|nr:hypothetical protein BS17DRAFT_816776 [Gyrodon lividus]